MVYVESSNLNQKAVLWAAGSTRTSTGRLKVQSPVEVSVRWDNSEQQSIDANGETLRIDGTIKVSQAVAIGSIMWLGELADWTASTGGLVEIVNSPDVPNLRGTRFTRMLGFRRYSDTLPQIES